MSLSTFFGTLREDFPMLRKKMHDKPLVYLDSAATTQKPQVVIDAIADFYTNHYATTNRAVYELAVKSTETCLATRQKVRDFIHAPSEKEIVFTRGTTDAINLVAASFGKAFVSSGDEILVSEIEHHANIVPWQILCDDRGAKLKVIPVNDAAEVDLEAYRRLLSSKTKLVGLVHVANALGTVNPIKYMCELAHDVGAKVLIDGAQSVPHIVVDVQDLGADFFVFSGHKMYGPTGVGVLFGKKELLEEMPPYQGGGDMIDTVTFEKTTYAPVPIKFEAGTPMIAQVVGLGAAVDYLTGIGMEAIASWEKELLDYGTALLEGIDGVKIIGTAKEKASIISFVVDGVHPLDIGTLIDLHGIAIRTGHHCAQPSMNRFGVSTTSRVSLAFYNTKEDLDVFVEALRSVIQVLTR